MWGKARNKHMWWWLQSIHAWWRSPSPPPSPSISVSCHGSWVQVARHLRHHARCDGMASNRYRWVHISNSPVETDIQHLNPSSNVPFTYFSKTIHYMSWWLQSIYTWCRNPPILTWFCIIHGNRLRGICVIMSGPAWWDGVEPVLLSSHK